MQGNLMQSEAQLAGVVQTSPTNLEARKLLARARLLMHQPESALRVLTPALDSSAADAEVYGLVGAVQAGSGDSAAAIGTLEAGARAHPDNVDFRLNLARAYLVARRPSEALAILEKLDTGGGRRDALLIAAVNAQRGPYVARETVSKLLAAKPEDVTTLNVAAEFFMSQWEFERARTLLHTAIGIDARNRTTLVNLARLDIATGDNARAETGLAAALALDERNDGVRIALADLMVRRGSQPEAAKLLQAGLDRGPTLDLQLALARAELSGGNADHGTAVLGQLASEYPGRGDVANRAGELLMQLGRYDAAEAQFHRAADLAPTNATYWLNLGHAALALDRLDPAREAFDRAVALRPEWAAALAARTGLDLKAKQYGAALERVNRWLERQPADPDLLVLKGDVEAAAGRLPEAVGLYTQAQHFRPDASTAVKLFRAQLDAALSRPEMPLVQWLAQQPADYTVRSILAEYYLSSGRSRESAAEFEQVVRQTPASAVALNNLACAYLQIGDPRAESVAQRAYELGPGSPAIADTLGWILARKHETRRALELLQKAAGAVGAEPDVQYHYAFALVQAGRREEADRILTSVLSGSGPFPARRDAERLLAELRA
jgi:putative PEP-CTERM system TPR-repeat lipoprotein